MVKRQFGVKEQNLKTINAFELDKDTQESEFFTSQRILHQTSYVATPQQNEVVERKHSTFWRLQELSIFNQRFLLPN